jgi:LPXTG-site transpeptidase (sortase) family protein
MTQRFHAASIFLIIPVLFACIFFAETSATDVVHAAQSFAQPTSLSIPSIHLTAPIVPVGVNAVGQMDVPSGKGPAVGWYDRGPLPGTLGNAVLDAHVFAAFSHLTNVKVGDSIYVREGAHSLRYVVESANTFPLTSLTSSQVFDARGGSTITLITCAGTYIPAENTYDHRLLVVARLVS